VKIQTATGGVAKTNGYVLIDETHQAAAIIDAPDHTVGPLLNAARAAGAEVVALLLTHGHFDHVADHAEVTRAFPGARVLISQVEEAKLQKPNATPWRLPFVIPPRSADGYLAEGQVIAVGALKLQALFTPGHAAGHMCLFLPAGEYDGEVVAQPVLFAGDLLMAGTVGRYDLLGDGDLPQLIASLRRVLALPAETVVLSGHGPATSIGAELRGNGFVRAMMGA
jgi:glyoxylase-like metal-dependent hydrolase (beta-lactamase superfamily II)